MNHLHTVMVVLNVLSAISVIVLVLLQHGKGADTGASFGGGASGSIFGASGSANFLSRSTAILVSLFFISSIGLSYLSVHNKTASSSSVLERINANPSLVASPSAVSDAAPSSAPSNIDPSSQIPR